jgi:two-component system response regulator CpxR
MISLKALGKELEPYDRSIDVHISKLRKKLGSVSDRSERIVTVRGVGYFYSMPQEKAAG